MNAQTEERRADLLTAAGSTAPAVARRRWWLVAVVATLLLAAGTLYLVNHRHDSAADAMADARTTGSAHIEELLSYDYRDIDRELASERAWLTASFLKAYKPLISETFAPAAKKAKLHTEATVVASGVESSGGNHVGLLVFVNVAVQQGGNKTPQITGSRLHVDLDKVDGEWLISAIDPI